MTLRVACAVSALVGFISLSYEIIWYRAFSFATGGRANVFGFLLFAFLLGIALGARVMRGGLSSEAGPPRSLLTRLRLLVVVANACAFLVIPVLARIVAFTHWTVGLIAVVLGAGAWGAALPAISHLAISPDKRTGQRLSYIYAANILGSVTGALVTGYVLLDRLSLETVSAALVIAGQALACWLAWSNRSTLSRPYGALLLNALLIPVYVAAVPTAFDALYERMLFKESFDARNRFANVVENRAGVITVTGDRTVYGSGVYDGVISTDFVHDRNWIVRAYGLSALHPVPRRVLMIGVASGAWAQVMANMPGVEELTAVEINPGFLSLIPRYAEVASVLTNPKVHVVVDDGRRWLARHPTLKFDLIVMNTTFHWRAHATNLLSREFLLLARSHLAAGGILHYNTTGSADALKTAFLTFPYGVRFINFATVSDSPLQWNEERFRRAMSAFTIDGRSVVDMTRAADRRAVDSAALLARNLNSRDQYAIESRESVLARLPDARMVTDDNMIPEWNAPRILQIVQILHRRISP